MFFVLKQQQQSSLPASCRLVSYTTNATNSVDWQDEAKTRATARQISVVEVRRHKEMPHTTVGRTSRRVTKSAENTSVAQRNKRNQSNATGSGVKRELRVKLATKCYNFPVSPSCIHPPTVHDRRANTTRRAANGLPQLSSNDATPPRRFRLAQLKQYQQLSVGRIGNTVTCRMYRARTPRAAYTQKEESAGSTVVELIMKATKSVMLVTVMETPWESERDEKQIQRCSRISIANNHNSFPSSRNKTCTGQQIS